jgi:DNA-binding NarL/FixJ family response regulator
MSSEVVQSQGRAGSVPAYQHEREPTLKDIVSRLAELQDQVTALTELVDAVARELRERLGVLEAQKRGEALSFPREPAEWETYLGELFATVLAPPLLPVCARLVLGVRTKEIAADLGRPLTTVKSQIAAIRDRLHLRRSEEIAPYVFEQFWSAYGEKRHFEEPGYPKRRESRPSGD